MKPHSQGQGPAGRNQSDAHESSPTLCRDARRQEWRTPGVRSPSAN